MCVPLRPHRSSNRNCPCKAHRGFALGPALRVVSAPLDSDDEGDTPEIALVYQARREREEKESREQSAKWAADYSRDEWKGRTRRKKVESPDDIDITKL